MLIEVNFLSHLQNAFGRLHCHANGVCTQPNENTSVRLHTCVTSNVSITRISRASEFHLGLVRLGPPLETISVNYASVVQRSFWWIIHLLLDPKRHHDTRKLLTLKWWRRILTKKLQNWQMRRQQWMQPSEGGKWSSNSDIILQGIELLSDLFWSKAPRRHVCDDAFIEIKDLKGITAVSCYGSPGARSCAAWASQWTFCQGKSGTSGSRGSSCTKHTMLGFSSSIFSSYFSLTNKPISSFVFLPILTDFKNCSISH